MAERQFGHLAAPNPPAGSRRRIPSAVKALVVVGLALAVSAGAAALAGGFEDRSTVHEHPAGESVDLGPVSIALHAATVHSDPGGPVVEVAAACRLNGASSVPAIQDRIADSALAGTRTPQGVLTSDRAQLSYGVTTRTDGLTRADLSPDLAPMPCLLTFDFAPGTDLMASDPDAAITVFLWKLEHVNASNLQDGSELSKTWEVTSDGVAVRLPVG